MGEATRFRLGLIGYGEIGSILGAGLRAAGLPDIAAYDLNASAGTFGPLIRHRAQEAGVALVASPGELAACSDLLVGVTPGSVSIESAEAFAPVLTAAHLFIDLASATPRIKQAVAARLAPNGTSFVDGSILGSAGSAGHAMPIVAAGPDAHRVRAMLAPYGMDIDVVGDAIGTASCIKILRSVVMKGIEALSIECLLGARRYGLGDVVLDSLNKSLSKPFAQTAGGTIRSDAIHAERRAEEAAMSAEALADIGLDPLVTRAVAERLAWVAKLGMKEHFNGEKPATYQEALDGIETRLAAVA